MKRFLSFLLAAGMILSVGGAFAADDAAYVASKGGEKYHYATCAVAKRISADKLVKFAKPEEAVKAGYTPCKTCNPPPTADALVASAGGEKYHKQNCKLAGNINTENKLYFKDNADAEKAGYKPCGVCFKK